MPLFWVWRLRLQAKKKAKVSLVFAAGLLYVYHHPGYRVLSNKTLAPASQALCGSWRAFEASVIQILPILYSLYRCGRKLHLVPSRPVADV